MALVGLAVGWLPGGWGVGELLGAAVGASVGRGLGPGVGNAVGPGVVGDIVGTIVGVVVGWVAGLGVGEVVGEPIGEAVAAVRTCACKAQRRASSRFGYGGRTRHVDGGKGSSSGDERSKGWAYSGAALVRWVCEDRA
mgnify:CR=1 FL=1